MMPYELHLLPHSVTRRLSCFQRVGASLMLFKEHHLHGGSSLWRAFFVPLMAASFAGLLLLHAPVFGQPAVGGQATGPFAKFAPTTDQSTNESLVLLDATGALTVEQVHSRFEAGEGLAVKQAQIMPADGTSALWYRVKLPSVDAPVAMVLTVPQPGMDSVDLYLPRAQDYASADPWQVQRSGDRVPVASWPLRYLYPAFGFQVLPHERRPAYLRVAHGYPTSVYWTLSPARSFHESSKQWHLLLGVYVGLALLLVLLNCVHAVSWRDPIHLFYAVYVLVIALGQLSLTGLGGEYFWPDSAWWNDSAPLALALAGAALLHLFLRQLVAERAASRLSWWLLFMAFLGGLLTLAFLALGRKPVFAFTAPYFLASIVTYLGAAGWYARRRPRVGLWVLAAMASLVLGAVFPLLRTMSLMPISAATQYGAQIGSALEVLLLLVALYRRNRERRDNQKRVGALARVDPLTGVASHAVMLQRLERLMLRQQHEPDVGAVLRIRLSNAIDIRQDYGMEAAQHAVVHAGACITGLAHEGDTVARHRDGDFVLILRGRITHAQLTDMGQRLIAHGLAESPALPPRTVLQLKVAVAEAPFKTTDAALLLRSLGDVLGELAGRSGTALRFVNSQGTLAPKGALQT
jgi:GGDEF domain-containing protein